MQQKRPQDVHLPKISSPVHWGQPLLHIHNVLAAFMYSRGREKDRIIDIAQHSMPCSKLFPASQLSGFSRHVHDCQAHQQLAEMLPGHLAVLGIWIGIKGQQ